MRYTRQELKQDKFADTAAEAVHWSIAHRRTMVNTAVAAVVVLALVLGGIWFYNYRSQQAQNALGNAMATYNAPVVPGGTGDPNIVSFNDTQARAMAAKKQFNEVAEKYGSTKSGKYARYFAALTEKDLGNTKAAEDQMKAMTEVGNYDIASLSKFALASMYRDSGRDSDAVALYKQLVEKPSGTVPKATAQLELAELYAAKQPDEARKIFEQIAKEDPKSLGAQIAQQRLAALK